MFLQFSCLLLFRVSLPWSIGISLTFASTSSIYCEIVSGRNAELFFGLKKNDLLCFPHLFSICCVPNIDRPNGRVTLIVEEMVEFVRKCPLSPGTMHWDLK